MSTWKSIVNADATEWLLERSNPSVRFFTLRDILGKTGGGQEVMEVKQEIMNTGVVPAILAKQRKEGYWETPESFYTAKYKGTVWQLIILAEHGADGKNDQIKNACEFILGHSQDPESFGFSHSASIKKGGGRHSAVIPCLTGNIVWSLIRLGYLNNARVQAGIRWITAYQRFDDGIPEPMKGWPYDRLKSACLGRHSCHMGAVKALKALAEIPEKKRSDDMKQMIDTGAEYLLIHHIYKRSHDVSRAAKPGWLQFGFPLMYQTDALEILEILTSLGYKDERMQEAIDVVISKQDDQGRWMLEKSFNGHFQVNIEQKGKPSKWITLFALRTLKRFYG